MTKQSVALTTTLINQVLDVWVHEFLVDVPAEHQGDKYLIDHDVLVNHIEQLSYDDLAEILMEVEDNYFVK